VTRLVIDASVAIKWVCEEEGSDLAIALLAHDLLAPDLWVSECANILWKKSARAESDLETALRAAAALQNVPIALEPMGRLLLTATEMAVNLGHPAYDCFYLALAALDGHPFATADMKLIRKLRAANFREAEVLTLAEAAALPL
jgi:predicted nucleic acid-binding protein